MNLLVSIPEVPQGSKVCGECNQLRARFFVSKCKLFKDDTGRETFLDDSNHPYPKTRRCPTCIAAEEAARKLFEIKDEKDAEDATWK